MRTRLLVRFASFRVIRTRFGLVLPGLPVSIIAEPDLALETAPQREPIDGAQRAMVAGVADTHANLLIVSANKSTSDPNNA